MTLVALPAPDEPPCPLAPVRAAPSARRGERALTLAMRHAGPRRVTVRWETQGDPARPALVVLGGISATRHVSACAADGAPGWWEAQVGPGRAIDPARWFVVAIDWVGADGAIDAPIDTADQADAVAAVLELLGVARLHVFVGASYGAMVALAFAARHGARVARLVVISGAHRPHPFASAWRGVQRKIVALARAGGVERDGLALARQLAMLGYRTPEEFAARFDAPVVLDGALARAASDAYLAGCGERYVARWSATAFLRLSESIDLHAVDPAAIAVPATIVAVDGDRLVPPAALAALAAGLGAPARLHTIASVCGHDAFLVETDAIAAILRGAIGGVS